VAVNNPKWKMKKLQEVPQFNEALQTFSATDWKLQWTNKSFNQRVKLVCEHEPTLEPMLVLAQMLTYTDASEMLHGTLWGILLLSGTFGADYKNPLKPTPAEVRNFYTEKITKPLIALSELTLLTIKIVADDNSDKLARHGRLAEAILSTLEPLRQNIDSSTC
jgi:hypothetical protein